MNNEKINYKSVGYQVNQTKLVVKNQKDIFGEYTGTLEYYGNKNV